MLVFNFVNGWQLCFEICNTKSTQVRFRGYPYFEFNTNFITLSLVLYFLIGGNFMPKYICLIEKNLKTCFYIFLNSILSDIFCKILLICYLINEWQLCSKICNIKFPQIFSWRSALYWILHSFDEIYFNLDFSMGRIIIPQSLKFKIKASKYFSLFSQTLYIWKLFFFHILSYYTMYKSTLLC